MEIIIGKTAGFCYGVKTAVNGAIQEAKNSKEKIYCLGEIVHNKQVVEMLEDLGIKCIETLDETKGKTLIRAHGVPKGIYETAKKMNIEIKDYTCPNVLKIHKIAEEYNKKGYFIILLGSKTHPENIGSISYCGENCCIIETGNEILEGIEKLKKSNIKNVLLIAQTTFSLEKFDNMQKKIQENLPKDCTIIVKNTICGATELRQKETDEISKNVDFMIIIGGKHSSNTNKLYDVAKKNCENTVLIETAKELDLKNKYEKIGIMAGASTPEKSINDVIEFLKK